MSERIHGIISLDDHVLEPPNIWVDRLPRKYRDIGPRVEYHPEAARALEGGVFVERPGTDGKRCAWWHYEDHYSMLKRFSAAAGYDRTNQLGPAGITFDEVRAGCWDPKARLEDMTLNGVAASLCFPNYPRFAGQLFLSGKDKDLARLCVEAYNDWMVDEWAGGSDGRLIPLAIVPLWDAELAAEEVRRNAARGVPAVAFSELPAWLGLPSIHSGYWDPFFRACDEMGTIVCMHIGSGTKMVFTSDDAPLAIQGTLLFANTAASLLDFLHSTVLARFPRLKLFYAECQIGWIPYVLERADDVWRTHTWSQGEDRPELPPSAYYRDRVYSCFFKDEVGVKLLERVGINQVTFETDYPHLDGTWPNSEAVAASIFDGVAPDIVDKVLRTNAIELFGLDARRFGASTGVAARLAASGSRG